jgi:hypothetical protein
VVIAYAQSIPVGRFGSILALAIVQQESKKQNEPPVHFPIR